MLERLVPALALLAVLSPLTLGACTDETDECTVDARDYDQSCAAAEDCVIVTDGNLCSDCRCPRAVINRSNLDAYEEDTSRIDSPSNGCDCDAFLDVECVDAQCRGITGPL